jgi:hypothetical protein
MPGKVWVKCLRIWMYLGRTSLVWKCQSWTLGGWFVNTKELHVMTYKEAMKTLGKPQRAKGAGREEHGRFKKHKVFKAVMLAEVPLASKILTSMWAMKRRPVESFELD